MYGNNPYVPTRPSSRKVNMSERDPSAAQQRPRDSQASAPASPAVLEFCVVGMGASAGGLEACRKFLAGLPANPGMAFVLVQHLDPTHQSLIAELLSGATAMPVIEAKDGMQVEADHLYVIPPGLYLSLHQDHLSLTTPLARHGARLPIDFLLHSLAVSLGARAACVILSGGGADGSIGAQAIKAAGGLVIAQDPTEAGQDGMPKSVIATGAVDFVLPAAEIAPALLRFSASFATAATSPSTAEVIALLKSLTTHDFTLYKTGTLERRIARRMTMAGFGAADTERYMERLRTDEDERQLLANDLLINVTSFFRDPKIFELLAASTIPALVEQADGTIRLWVAGCSTGEETYSLAMLLLECIEASPSHPKLQIFATDVDAQAVMQAREGIYSSDVIKDVSAARLARFFVPEERGYRVSAALRACVVFAVQDVLSDPPFSKLNMISCRNLLIYIKPEAQAKIIAIFNFALRTGGYLLLGAAETIAAPDPRFEQISKPARLYRKLGPTSGGALPGAPPADFLRLLPPTATPKPKASDMGELCRKLLVGRYAPAALLVNARLECLYSFGPVDMFLRTATGPTSPDLLAQLPSPLRTRTRDAVVQAASSQEVIHVEGGRITRDGNARLFHLEIQAVSGDSDKFLVCLIEEPKLTPPVRTLPANDAAVDSTRVAELEAELVAVRADLEQAVNNLESAAEEHNAINEEALSVNEEYQSTNEELLTSKEELQSLNEELTALNSQLQETLERSRMTTTDLRNVLNSTDVPTLFLDSKLKIRFFTPSATLLFHIIDTDIGRKLGDFRSLANDSALLPDAARVLATGAPVECQIKAETGIWYLRRVQAYRGFDGAVGGVVITFSDMTERNAARAEIEEARIESDRANLAKSRFLAGASHDLRQPLQSMALIAGMLGKTAANPASQKLVGRLEHMMQSITTMLNAMLDINQIEAGIVRADIVSVDINGLLSKLEDKFADQAVAQNTVLRVVPCHAHIATDPALLEQMLSNLLGNALKYTKGGRVLLGCRRRGKMLNIEVLDTGIGIAADQLQMIFDEYHQIGNIARERSRGLGLGLSIVQRLGVLLGHKINVHSVPGRGSVFSIAVARALAPEFIPAGISSATPQMTLPPNTRLLVIEDDPDISQLLKTFLAEEGVAVHVAHDAAAAKALVAAGDIEPDLILADFNLPGAQTGLAAALDLRLMIAKDVPVIIMTGDISTATLRLIADEGFTQINKPMKLASLMTTLETVLAGRAGEKPPAIVSRLGPGESRTIYIVDDDTGIREAMGEVFKQAGKDVASFPDAESFLASMPATFEDCCLLIDADLPGISGLQLLQKLATDGIALPSIMVTGLGDIGMAVRAMKAGAADFLEKPVTATELLATVRRVLDEQHSHQERDARHRNAAQHIAALTKRQRDVMDRVLAGQPSKNIAADLGISQRTVENHRAAIMQKTGVKSIPALARLAVMAMQRDD
jgi:two-component system CheB/CheR fusion protein